ncbi:hypothetical protein HDU97_001697 [Phlyctochytrium planicorne]|nr:hypothetical protein HDU97_001697 [Phlyctochytrium planicorne]
MPRAAKEDKPKKEKAPRKPSAYNTYMKAALPKIKAADPSLSHKEAFKKAAEQWKDSPDNPANQK